MNLRLVSFCKLAVLVGAGAMFCAAPAFADECTTAASELNKGVQLSDGSAGEEAHYRKAIQFCGKLAEAHYNLGLNLLRQGKAEEAVGSFRKAVELHEDATFLIGLGTALATKGDLVAAEKEFRAALKLSSDLADAHAGIAAVAERQNKYDQAEDSIRAAIQIAPNEGMHFLNLAVVLEKLGRSDEAITALETAIAKRSDLAPAYAHLGRLLTRQKKFDKAEPALLKASYLSPKDPGVWIALGGYYTERGDLNQAKTHFEKALAIDGKNVSALTDLGITMIQLDDETVGVAKLREAAELAPQDSRAQGALGWALLRDKQLDEAERLLLAAVKADDKNALAQNNLGVLYELKGAKEKAVEYFSKAGSLDPTLEEAKANLERLKK